MIGPQLQKAIFDALQAAGVAGGRVYDSVPAGAPFPYVTIGDEQSIDDGNQCAALFEVYHDIHVWSRKPGRIEVKEIGQAVREALAAELAVADHAVILSEFENSRVMLDPDGLTAHAVLTFRFLLQPV